MRVSVGRGMPPENLLALREWLSLRRLATAKPTNVNTSWVFSAYLGDKTLTVFVSETEVAAKSSESVIPRGFRRINLQETAFLWRYDRSFRAFICTNTDEEGIWIEGVGLQSEGPHRISATGALESVTSDAYHNTPFIERAYLHPGSRPVWINIGDNEDDLMVFADDRSKRYLRRVAYTRGFERFESKANMKIEAI